MTPELKEVFRYFARFSYPPSKDEIYLFLKKRASKQGFEKAVASLQARKKLKTTKGIRYPNTPVLKYTLEEYGNFLNKNKKNSLLSQSKLKRIKFYILLLKLFPQVRFVGLSGSISMLHANEEDDIDLFIITTKKRLWTARFLANILAFTMGIKRKRLAQQAKDKVCLNLFFDESSLVVPKSKQNEYVGHEVLQVKPLVNKANTYERFLEANSWVLKIFPNAQTIMKNYIKPSLKPLKKQNTSLGNKLEQFLKHVQLLKINKNRTSEIITAGQLWFFPDDFERKINRV